ncbi:RNA polymerase sigma-70 factor [Pedobacter agri]|uniref:RNA polymerase sigma factor n=1 Tax=Pedobacter agri TaxID=454586 RepID=UPI00292D8E62|nr:RNA polymerase sigma-70 factor [Pedobacter agri]
MTLKPLSNQQALQDEIALGNHHAFATIYYHYYDNIYAYAFYLVKSDVIAEEIVQEAFLRFWIKGKAVSTMINVESFLVTIVRNRSIDILRKVKSEQKFDKERLSEWNEGHNDTEEQVMLNEGKKILQEAIDNLPAQQRLVYQLCHQQNMKYDDAARALNLSPETVKSYMKLALKSLRKFIKSNSDYLAIAVILKLF